MLKDLMQRVFDKTLEHLRVQGVAAVNSSTGDCCYRWENGNACAVGVHMTKEVYVKWSRIRLVENVAVSCLPRGMLLEMFPETNELTLVEKSKFINFLMDMQKSHDKELAKGSVSSWECSMEQLASKYGLHFTQKREPNSSECQVAANALKKAAEIESSSFVQH